MTVTCPRHFSRYHTRRYRLLSVDLTIINTYAYIFTHVHSTQKSTCMFAAAVYECVHRTVNNTLISQYLFTRICTESLHGDVVLTLDPLFSYRNLYSCCSSCCYCVSGSDPSQSIQLIWKRISGNACFLSADAIAHMAAQLSFVQQAPRYEAPSK